MCDKIVSKGVQYHRLKSGRISVVLFFLMLFSLFSTFSANSEKDQFLRIGKVNEWETTNIYDADATSFSILSWFYPSLYYRAPITAEITPDVAESMWTSSDDLTYTVRLRKNVTWDDGTPLTAHDFVFHYNTVKELQIPEFLDLYGEVNKFEAVDDYTIRINLKKCTFQFREYVVYSIATPQHQFQPLLEEARKTSNPLETFQSYSIEYPVSAGPFSWGGKTGSKIELSKNPHYYGKGRTVEAGRLGTLTEELNFAGIKFVFYTGIDSAINALKRGEIDYIWEDIPSDEVYKVENSSNLSVERSPDFGFYYLALNHAQSPFNDLDFRQALAYLVDKEEIVSELLGDNGIVAHSVVSPAAGDWYNPYVEKFGYTLSRSERIAKAKRMLEDAGYTVPQSGYPSGVLKLPNGKPMQSIELLTPPLDYDPVRANAGKMIQDWWREIGIPVTVTHTSFGEIVRKTFETMTFDTYILGWRVYEHPSHMHSFFHSSEAVPDGYNPVGYKNPRVDRLLEKLVEECDEEEQVGAAQEAQEIIIEEVGYIPLYHKHLVEVYRDDIFEGWFSDVGNDFFDGYPYMRRGVAESIPYLRLRGSATSTSPASSDSSLYLYAVLVMVAIVVAGIVVQKKRHKTEEEKIEVKAKEELKKIEVKEKVKEEKIEKEQPKVVPVLPVTEKKCPACGNKVKVDDIYCAKCGKNLLEKIETKKVEKKSGNSKKLICPVCKNEIEEHWVSCPLCGTKLKDDTRIY